MQSSGGLTEHGARRRARGADGALRPCRRRGRRAGAGARAPTSSDVLCLDMGGTSCDVCMIDGRPRVPETAQRTIAGRPLALPALDIHTVGAGGGSIAWRDAGGALRVGPPSAGAQPGARLLRARRQRGDRDRRQPAAGPAARGLAAGRRADARPRGRTAAVARLRAELDLDATSCAEGIVRVAEAQMLGRAARDDRRARHRPARRWRCCPSAAPGRCTPARSRGALGIARIAVPARVRRALRARTGRRGPPARRARTVHAARRGR